MSEFEESQAFLKDYRSKHPRRRHYPPEFWTQALPLAKKHGISDTAAALGISKQHLSKKLRKISKGPRNKTNGSLAEPSFVSGSLWCRIWLWSDHFGAPPPN